MFKITPVQLDADATELMSACSAEIKEGCFIYAMTDCESGRIMGISQFEIKEGYGYIYDIKEAFGGNDFEAMFILARQTMNFINLCGIDICRADLNAGDKSLIKAVGFKEGDEYFECSLIGMFDGSHCSGHK
ncbi:MAG: hypothetical protein E7673_05265 [Ruminococcaceae bacterium]|nr:hypothetical protein [Oscillospiraceae bacterium]